MKDTIAKLCSNSYNQGAVDFKLSLLEALNNLEEITLLSNQVITIIDKIEVVTPVFSSFIKETNNV